MLTKRRRPLKRKFTKVFNKNVIKPQKLVPLDAYFYNHGKILYKPQETLPF